MHCLNYCLPIVVNLCKCYCVLHSITVDTFKETHVVVVYSHDSKQ